MRLICLFTVAGLSCLSGPGCGDTRCGDQERSSSDRAPVLTDFYVLDREIPGDPWTVLLGATFTDTDGNLEGGVADFYLNNDSDATTQKLVDVFRQSGVTTNATAGDIWMALRFSPTVKDGADVRLGLQLADAGGERSNCYTLDLTFDVKTVAHADGIGRLKARHIPCSRRST